MPSGWLPPAFLALDDRLRAMLCESPPGAGGRFPRWRSVALVGNYVAGTLRLKNGAVAPQAGRAFANPLARASSPAL